MLLQEKKGEQRMTKDTRRGMNGSSVSGGVYGLGFIGALVYYIQHAATLGAGLLGFLKAVVWPAILVYNLLAWLKL